MKAHLGSQLIYRETRSAMTFSIFCLAGVLLLCAMGLFPAFSKGRKLQQRIDELNEERNVQQRIQPFLIALMTAEDAITSSPDLVIVKKKPLPRAGLLDFDKRIIAMAKRFELEAASVEVKVDEINRGDLVVVDACLTGNFNDFRRFLLHLGQLSWVQDFDSLEITGYRDQEQLNVEFKLALE